MVPRKNSRDEKFRHQKFRDEKFRFFSEMARFTSRDGKVDARKRGVVSLTSC